MLILQVVSALLLLLNKFYVFKKRTIGWTFGILGTVTITAYFYLQMTLEHKLNLWIMIVYDVALFFLMIYGYLVSHSVKNIHLNEILKKWNVPFKVVVVSLTIMVCSFLLKKAITADLVVEQFLSAVGGLVGTLMLAFNKSLTNRIGWVTYFFTHLVVTYLMIKTNSPFIAICQVLSAIVSIFGFRRELQIKAHPSL